MKSHKTFKQDSKLNLQLRINYLMQFQFPREPRPTPLLNRVNYINVKCQ